MTDADRWILAALESKRVRVDDDGSVWRIGIPEMAADFAAVTRPIEQAIARTGHAWRKHAGIDDRKAFAAEVKAEPFASVLFRLFGDRPTGDVDHEVEHRVRALNTAAILRAIGAS